LDSFSECAHCGAEPFRGGSDPVERWSWLQQNAPELLQRVQKALFGRPGIGPDWERHLDPALRREVILRLDKSSLTNDHSIPRKLGNQNWLKLSPDEREVLQNDLVFKLCRNCNLGKSAKLIDRESIVATYCSVNYGSEAAARADVARWNRLCTVLDLVYRRASA
jgi:hypothetical protein